MKKGFTLIEIVIVIALIALSTSLGFTAFSRYRSAVDQSGEVRELIDDLRYAKELSVSQQIKHGIDFDFNNNGYLIVKDGSEKEILDRKHFSTGVQIKDVNGYSEVRFTNFGAVFRAGSVLIRKENNLKEIIIKPSGFIDVERSNIN